MIVVDLAEQRKEQDKMLEHKSIYFWRKNHVESSESGSHGEIKKLPMSIPPSDSDAVETTKHYIYLSFSDKTYFDAGVGSHLHIGLSFLTHDNTKKADVDLWIDGDDLNNPKREKDLANKIRHFVKDLKELYLFGLKDSESQTPPRSESYT